MRTNIVIDNALMRDAMKLSGIGTKREIVEESLRLFVRLHRQKDMRSWFGKLRWEGDLDAMRED